MYIDIDIYNMSFFHKSDKDCWIWKLVKTTILKMVVGIWFLLTKDKIPRYSVKLRDSFIKITTFDNVFYDSRGYRHVFIVDSRMYYNTCISQTEMLLDVWEQGVIECMNYYIYAMMCIQNKGWCVYKQTLHTIQCIYVVNE